MQRSAVQSVDVYVSDHGVLSWTPECQNGSSTNIVTVIVKDRVLQNVMTNLSVRIIVPECVQAGVGGTVVRAGQQGCITIDLFSSVDLTNLVFTIEFPS